MAPHIAGLDLPFQNRVEADATEGPEQVIAALVPRVERFPAVLRLVDLVHAHKTN